MATTWQGRRAPWLSASFDALVAGDFSYEVKREAGGLIYSIGGVDGPKIGLPVEIAMGGRRHGLGLLAPIEQVDGIPLARRALVQARYAWSPEQKKLLLAPGCSAAKPQSMEAALGLVLSPGFESRCVSCHGQPMVRGTGESGGVHCESCHGPGSGHLAAVGRGDSQGGIVNPQRLSTEDSIAVCAECHVGLARFSDPSAGDLLIANQVRAIRSSECFLQSGKAFSCTACHEPHSDSAEGDDRLAVKACLGCHASGVKMHAAICPVNASTGCIGCHMPSVEMGPLHLVDHLIRVHPEQKVQAGAKGGDELGTQVRPISEYLRMIATNSKQAAEAARDRIERGEQFYNVAREMSVDNTAAIGGYLGLKAADGATGNLNYGETGGVVQSGGRWVIFQRLPRDFRWDAEQVEQEAEDLAAHGEVAAAIGKAQQALMIYPHFLRALNFIGYTLANSGNPQKAVSVLQVAARLYPNDARTEFALASTLGLVNDRAGAAEGFRRTIALDGDLVEAYGKLGTISYSGGDWASAIKTFRQGLQIDPMCAELYYDLSVALEKSGDAAGAKQARALASGLSAAWATK